MLPLHHIRMAVLFSDTSHGGDVLSASRKRDGWLPSERPGLHAGWGLDACVRQRSSTFLPVVTDVLIPPAGAAGRTARASSARVRSMGSDIPMRVGLTGFEPATPCSQSTCATKLRHNPIFLTGLRGLPATYVPY